MKTEKKAGTYKLAWAAKRSAYMWYLKPPFKGKFDRKHWWTTARAVEPVSALYELARRHPLVGERMMGGRSRSCPPQLLVLADIGLKSWVQLSSGQQSHWKIFASNLKGVDCRNDDEKCFSVAWQGDGDPLQRAAKLCRGESLSSATEVESAFARAAMEAYRRGYVVLAVAPGLGVDVAEKLLRKKYGEYRLWEDSVNGAGKQRARNDDWLPIIAEFERDVTNKKAPLKPDVFKRYKRVIDGIDFTGR